jgi:hypothetical protein
MMMLMTFGRTIRLGRMPSVRRKRRKRRNVSGRRLQSSVEGVRLLFRRHSPSRKGRLAALLNPSGITTEIMAHEIRICGSTRTNPCRTASSNSLRNNLLGRFGAFGRSSSRIVPIISSASLEIGRRALLVICHFNDSRNPSRNLGICAVRVRVGTSTPVPARSRAVLDPDSWSRRRVQCSQCAPRQVDQETIDGR